MPAKNTTKFYLENGYYHIYNRGVEKRNIFLDEQDYSVILSYLKEYLSQKDETNLSLQLSDPDLPYKERERIIKILRLNNFSNEIYLLAYCLMPNHFHFFIKQKNQYSIDKFMNSLFTRYSVYFNKKNKRVGPLFQDVYKAVSVTTDEQAIYLTKYIHKQSLASQGVPFGGYHDQPSSYPEYIGLRNTNWVYSNEILSQFYSKFTKQNQHQSYKSFIEDTTEIGPINSLIIE